MIPIWELPGDENKEQLRSESLPGVADGGARAKYLQKGLVLELIRRGDLDLAGALRRASRRRKDREQKKLVDAFVWGPSGSEKEACEADPVATDDSSSTVTRDLNEVSEETTQEPGRGTVRAQGEGTCPA